MSHIHLSVSDLNRSLAFYIGLMGREELCSGGLSMFLRTPDARELLALQPVEDPVDPKAGGIAHFGFYVTSEDMDTALVEVRATGVDITALRPFVSEPFGALETNYPTQ